MSIYIQLGTSGSFTAPAAGQLVLQCEDGIRTDNSGSLPVTIAGVLYTAESASDVNGPVVVAGQTYQYSCPMGDYWNGGSGNVWFNADGVPRAGNNAQFSSQFAPDVNGVRPFSLVGRIDGVGGATPFASTGSRRLYSTGVLEASVSLNGQAQTLQFALVQNATIECRFQEKSVYAAADVSRFPQATAYHEGMWSVKINAGEFSSDALQLLASMRAGASGPGYVAQVIADGEIELPEFSGTFTASTPDGTQVIWQFRRLLSKAVTLPFKLSDFLYSGLDLTAVGDASGGIVDLLVA